MTVATPDTTCIDWFRVLADLKDVGYGLREIEHFTAIPRSSLFGYRSGAEPKYSTGQRLVRFWAEAVSKTADDAPTIGTHDYRR